jgi:hypothetical protein
MCKIKTDVSIIKYCLITLINLILSISGFVSILTVYKLYETTLLFYFLLYNIVVSVFGIFHFLRVFKDMLNEELKDKTYVGIKLLLMIASFIWGTVILSHNEIIVFYQNNYPRVYVSFINFFIMSSLGILDMIYKITYYFHNREKIESNSLDSDSQFIAKLEEDFKDDYP